MWVVAVARCAAPKANAARTFWHRTTKTKKEETATRNSSKGARLHSKLVFKKNKNGIRDANKEVKTQVGR
jgi:hypothetical protein